MLYMLNQNPYPREITIVETELPPLHRLHDEEAYRAYTLFIMFPSDVTQYDTVIRT